MNTEIVYILREVESCDPNEIFESLSPLITFDDYSSEYRFVLAHFLRKKPRMEVVSYLIHRSGVLPKSLLVGCEWYANQEMYELILKYKIPLHGLNKQGRSLLHEAASSGLRSEADHLDACQFLVTQGLDVNEVSQFSSEVMKGYVENFTPLVCAVRAGAPGITEFLIQSGATVEYVDPKGMSVLDHAKAKRSQACIDLITAISP